MPFATVAVPFDAYAALPSPQHRWLMMCLARYADRDGRCWPSMRQIAADARMSLASVCRYLASMSEIGVFHRQRRRGGGRYVYVLADHYRPAWGGRVPPLSGRDGRVPTRQRRVPEGETRQANPQSKVEKSADFIGHDDSLKWEARLRGWHKRRMWLPFWGPKPNEPGCWVPVAAECFT